MMKKIIPGDELLDAIWEAIYKELCACGVTHLTSDLEVVDGLSFDQDQAHAVARAAWDASKQHLEDVIAPLVKRIVALERDRDE
jgi:hypothetical protein